MARLIDADKIVNGIALYMAENAYLNDTPLDALKMVANWIIDAPTVEVVRCKDCKHLYDEMDDYCCMSHRGLVKICENSFCSYGERKDGDK